MPRDTVATYDTFAVSAPGIEHITAGELRALGVDKLEVVDGGVEFTAARRQLYEANLHLRTASRVLVRLARFKALTFAELERRARRIPWEKVLSEGQSVQLRVTCKKSRLYHSDAVAERIARDLKARVDANVTKSDGEDGPESEPDAQLIVVRFDHDRCTVSADSSGAHLHQRGYRTSVTAAPIRETLAAAMILASDWDRTSPLLDPFCGSGTIPIEAALMAARIAPGRNRTFQFARWPGYDGAEWKRVHAAAIRGERRDALPRIEGSDRTASAIRAAVDNAERAGVSDLVQFRKADATTLSDGHVVGCIVSNPPYGVRLGDAADARRLMTLFGRQLRDQFIGWQVSLLSASQDRNLVGFGLTQRLKTTNGGLRVQLLTGVVPGALEPASTTAAVKA